MNTIPSTSGILKNIFLGCMFVLAQVSTNSVFAQGCDPSVPTYIVDLTGQPNGTYISPPDIRNGNCCGTTAPDQCIQFIITLDSMSNGIIFSIASGAIPPGAIFYQVNCGPPTPVGNMLCLTGVGPHSITFCKPGNNSNQYQITALAQPQSGPDITTTAGCSQPLYVNGLDAPSTTWTSIYPGATGAYNSYLSCTSGCDSVMVTPGAGAPAYVDYLVCGYVFGGCFPFSYCDTLRVNINQDLTSINSNISCFGQTTGSIDLTVPGSSPVTYSWSNGSTTEDISGLPAGSYSVVVTDAGGCTRTLNTNITQPSPLSVTGATAAVSCFGGSNGSVNITTSGGTGGYLFSWSNGSTTEDISGLTAGNYSVTVTDANGCTSSYSTTVTQPLSALVITGTSTNAQCFGTSTGSIDISPSGGTPAYTYAWSNGSSSQDIAGLASGNYSVTVTDANNCVATYTTIINQPSSPLNVTSIPSNVLCFGGTTGAVDITPSGGTPGYTYVWSNGSTTQDISGLVSGSYSVTVTDINGCSITHSAAVTQPDSALSITGTSTNVLCFGGLTGSVDITVSGGTPGYTYAWSNSSITQDLSALSAGIYSVIVTDANGCTNTYSSSITQPSSALSVNGLPTHVLCFGNTTGSIDVTTSGGTPGYTYVWSNGAVTEDISGLSSGIYTVTVTDANGCSNSSFSLSINQPALPLSLNVTQNNILCFGGTTGSIDITPMGGTAGYTYTWSNGSNNEDITAATAGSYTVISTDANGCTASYTTILTQPASALDVTGSAVNVSCFGGANGYIDISPSGGTPGYIYSWSNNSTSQDISGLSAGSYNVIVTDANGCTNSTFSVTITQPATALNVNGSGSNVLCYGENTGSIDINVSGGTPSYTYLWSNGTVTEDISGIAAGTYNVVVTDANGCTNSTFGISILQPLAIDLSGSPSDPTCNGYSNGNIILNPSGGTVPYSYGWNTGSPDKDIYNLVQGGYNVTVTDANGCTATGNWVLTDPVALNLQPVINPILCFGSTASITLNITGGALPYSVLWNNGSTATSISSLSEGNYSVVVTDSKGCSVTDAYNLIAPPLLTVDLDSLHTVWLGQSVTLEAIPNGGTAPYTYSWNPTDHLNCSDCSITEASPNDNTSYMVTVTDQNGCTATAGAFIEVLFVMYVPNSFTPNGDNDNDVFLAVSESVKDFTMRIFDRWGEEIFTSSNINDGWNGTFKQSEVKQDVYVYRIEATFLNGVHRELIGQVNLLR